MAKQNQFRGLPMEQLIGAPLSALCEGQVMLASATKDYIETVGLDENKNIIHPTSLKRLQTRPALFKPGVYCFSASAGPFRNALSFASR